MFEARKFEPSDEKPDWRDPNMPCVVRVQNQFTGRNEEWMIDPAFRQQHAQQTMLFAPQPNWRTDPTYNMRRKR